MQVQMSFEGFPEVVKSLSPDACKLLSRSPRVHIMRLALTPMLSGKRSSVDDNKLEVVVENSTRRSRLATQSVVLSGKPVEVELEGEAQTGDELEVALHYQKDRQSHSDQGRCTVD
jgi:hypothetical protein